MTKRIVSGIFILTSLGALGVILAGALSTGEQLIVRFLTAVIVAALGLYVISDLRLQAEDEQAGRRSRAMSRITPAEAPPNSTAAFMATVTRKGKATRRQAESEPTSSTDVAEGNDTEDPAPTVAEAAPSVLDGIDDPSPSAPTVAEAAPSVLDGIDDPSPSAPPGDPGTMDEDGADNHEWPEPVACDAVASVVDCPTRSLDEPTNDHPVLDDADVDLEPEEDLADDHHLEHLPVLPTDRGHELQAADYADAPLAPIIDLRDVQSYQTAGSLDVAIKAGEVEVIAALIEQGMLATDGPISDREVRTMVYVAFTSNELRKLLQAGGAPDGSLDDLDLGPVELFDEQAQVPPTRQLYAGAGQPQTQLG